MMKMRIAAALAAVMIGTAALPTVTAFAQGNDPEQTAAAETTAPAAESAAETSAVTETAETDEKGSTDAESKETESEAAGDEKKTETFDLSSLDLSGIPGVNLDVYADILSDLDPEVAEVLLKNPKLLAYFLPTLHVTVTDNAVTIAVDGDEPEEDPIRTGHVRTNGSNLNVRTGPGIGFDIINSLANGTEVQVMKEENGWYQLEFPAKYGYVCGKYLELNDITPKETPEGYTFDIDGEMMAGFLSAFSGMFEEPQTVPDIHGLTPDGNLSLVDDIGPITGEGQQFVTLVTKAGNYFYLIIDRNEKGEETVHFLNMVDERDLFSLMDEDEASALAAQMEAEKVAQEAAAATPATPSDQEKEPVEPEKEEKPARNMLPALIALLVLLGGGGAFAYMQLKGMKQQEAERPDPDADYEDEDMSDYDMPETEEEAEASEEEEDYSDDSDEDEDE